MADTVRDSYDYVIIGGGMIGHLAAEAIHQTDPDGSIVVVGREPDPPVARPALSKQLWNDPDFAFEQVWLPTADVSGAEVLTGESVTVIERGEHRVATTANRQFGYGKLLIATGGTPNRLDLPADDRVIYFRTVADYRRLRELSGPGRHVVVVGGGFIGTELAIALANNDTRVTMLFLEDEVGGSLFPADLAADLSRTFTEHGIQLKPGTKVSGGAITDDGIRVRTEDGAEFDADAVVVGLGISPATTLAEEAGLEVDDGVVVDDHLVTSDPDVFAAGDVASYPDRLFGRRRVEHVDNARQMGARAGANMAGDVKPYDHTPFYYSVLFGTRYEAVGTLDATLTLVEDWNDDRSKGVVYYTAEEGGRTDVRGVLLWNVAEKTDEARRVIAASQHGDLSADDLVGQIPRD